MRTAPMMYAGFGQPGGRGATGSSNVLSWWGRGGMPVRVGAAAAAMVAHLGGRVKVTAVCARCVCVCVCVPASTLTLGSGSVWWQQLTVGYVASCLWHFDWATFFGQVLRCAQGVLS